MINVRFNLIFLLLLAVLVLGPGKVSADDKQDFMYNVIGVYYGVMVSGGTDCPGKTTFVLDNEGKLSGSYDFIEPSGRLFGTLTDCESSGFNKLVCTWRDKEGKGSLEMKFNTEITSFSGFWSMPGSKARYPWNGTK